VSIFKGLRGIKQTHDTKYVKPPQTNREREREYCQKVFVGGQWQIAKPEAIRDKLAEAMLEEKHQRKAAVLKKGVILPPGSARPIQWGD